MSINMRILPIGDDEIQALVSDHKRLEDPSLPLGGGELYEHWRRLDCVLGGDSFLIRGDLVVDNASSEPIHVVRSENVAAVAANLTKISDDDVRSRLDPESMRRAGQWVTTYETRDTMLREILPAIETLRRVVLDAAKQSKGLVIWRYEWL